MKHIAIAALFAAATLIMAGSAFAQQEQAVQANIPFSFTVNNSQLPAGTYAIWSDSETNRVIDLSNRAKSVHILALPMTIESASENSSVLVFHKYGEKYFLSEIRSANSSTDTHFPMSAAEKRARSEAQDAGLRVQKNVTVALNSYPGR